MKKLTILPTLASLAILVGCSTTPNGITPAQIQSLTSTAVLGLTLANQMTPSISNDLNMAAIGLKLISVGTNITAAQVTAATSKITDPKARAAVQIGLNLWLSFGQQPDADVGAGLSAMSDGIEAGLGNPPVVLARKVAVRSPSWTKHGKAWRVR